ncbi:NUDIX hydrolase domain-like protein [Hygrophoropsis aurantiaca]|uniref:NUDIX hydrolase domain-like protein n=1 Tax=Hygrophoropsis aurantiaca TaxID=72124 RepID=A0ACB8AEZ9_9AGAM|nr:NUDIX hydrolase domain-like protein [Hygrophoropsis aurantiaca]
MIPVGSSAFRQIHSTANYQLYRPLSVKLHARTAGTLIYSHLRNKQHHFHTLSSGRVSLTFSAFPFQRAVSNLNMAPSTRTSESTPATPRPSASLIIINERNEVLLVQRNPKARSFGGTHVFPGGNFDPKQDGSLEITAIRETFEESGLLIATPDGHGKTVPSNSILDEARKAIHGEKLKFQAFLSDHSLKATTQSLLPFTTWVTPPISARRFRTQFYVVFLPASSSTGFSSGDKEDRLPTPDGGQEVIAARFVSLEAAIEEFRTGRISLMPPQYYIIETLRPLLLGNTNTREQQNKVAQLSQGAFGKLVINPQGQRDKEGRDVFVYEGDELRGGPSGRLHRAVVARQGTVFSRIELLRNFDIFTQVEGIGDLDKAKL